MSWSERRIMAVAAVNNAECYLEIGVNKGETFLNVPLPAKDGVDPQFLFNTSAHSSADVRFFSQFSDDFWISGSPRTYDIIFIDGLHTFEQTFRDFASSLMFAHGRTVWLLDDTLPCDVFSALPDQQKSFRERARANLPGLPWHGDVYKIVPAIHDFFPTFRYATITGSGNPQTLLWAARRDRFQPRFNNLETISRLSYFDIDPNIDLFNVMGEAEAVNLLRADFAGAPR